MTLWQLKTSNGYKYVTDINKVDAKEYLSAKKLDVDYVCSDCGAKHGRKPKGVLVTTMHLDNCDVCGKVRGLCHIRHFNYLRK